MLRLGCPGSLMSLDGPTFHVTPVDLGIIFQCKLYVTCIMSCEKKTKSELFQIASNLKSQISLRCIILDFTDKI